MQRIQLSGGQFFFIIFVSITSLTYFSLPTQLIALAKQDVWLSMVIGTLIDIYVAYILFWLGRRYPDQSLIQYSGTILGRIGWLIGFIFVLFFFVVIASAMWLFCKFLSSSFMSDTPGIIFSATMTLAAGLAAYCGLESIARMAQIIAILILLVTVALFLLSIPEMDLHNLLPQFENGLGPAVKGAVYPGSWFGICIMMGLLMPHLATPEQTFRMKASAVILGSFIMTLMLLYSIAVLGSYMATHVDFPTYVYTRVIHLAFLERFDILLMLIYISGTFITFSTLYYVLSEGAAQLFGTRTHRSWVLGFAIFFVASPLIPFSSNSSFSFLYFNNWFPVCSLAIEGGLTTILFVTAWVKNKYRTRKEATSDEH